MKNRIAALAARNLDSDQSHWRILQLQRKLEWLRLEAARLDRRHSLLPISIDRLRQQIIDMVSRN